MEATPFILGFILGPMFEENFRRTLLFSKGSLSIFIQRPITFGFLVAIALVILSAGFSSGLRRYYAKADKNSEGVSSSS